MAKLALVFLLALGTASAEKSCAAAGNCPEDLDFEADAALGLLQTQAFAHSGMQTELKDMQAQIARLTKAVSDQGDLIKRLEAKAAESGPQAANTTVVDDDDIDEMDKDVDDDDIDEKNNQAPADVDNVDIDETKYVARRRRGMVVNPGKSASYCVQCLNECGGSFPHWGGGHSIRHDGFFALKERCTGKLNTGWGQGYEGVADTSYGGYTDGNLLICCRSMPRRRRRR